MAYHKGISKEKESEIIEYWQNNIENKTIDVAKATGVTVQQAEKCLDKHIRKLSYGFRT